MLFVRRLFDLYRDHSWQCVTVFFVLYFVVLLGGAAIFKSIEEPAEKASMEALAKERNIFLTKIREGCNSTITENDVDAFVRVVLLHGNQKITVYKNYTSEQNWGLGQAVFFAGTIITTLGYAQTTYLTDGGKIFAIFYICIGVPLTLFFFTAVCHQVNRLFLWQKSWMAFYLPNFTDLQVKLIHFSAVCLVLWITLLLIPAAIFYGIEGNWNYLDAFYYCFLSMTTVGMVDNIPGDGPGQSNKSLYKFSVLLYLYIGLVGVLSALRLFSDIAPSEDALPPSANSSFVAPPEVDNFRRQRLKEERNALDETQAGRGYSSINPGDSSFETEQSP